MRTSRSSTSVATSLGRQASFNTCFNEQLRQHNILSANEKIDVRGLEGVITTKAYDILRQTAQAGSSRLPANDESFATYINYPTEGTPELRSSEFSYVQASSCNAPSLLPRGMAVGDSAIEASKDKDGARQNSKSRDSHEDYRRLIERQFDHWSQEQHGFRYAEGRWVPVSEFAQSPLKQGHGYVSMAEILANQGPLPTPLRKDEKSGSLFVGFVEPPSKEMVDAPGFLEDEGLGCVDMALFLANQGGVVSAQKEAAKPARSTPRRKGAARAK